MCPRVAAGRNSKAPSLPRFDDNADHRLLRHGRAAHILGSRSAHMSFASFWSDLAATILGGIVLAVLFFFSREKLLPLPALAGRWYMEQLTVTSAYSPYLEMILRYILILYQEGNTVHGTAEKIYERSSTGEREFVGEKRTRAIVSGHVEKKYFSRDKLYLHVVEDGHGRESTHFYELTVNRRSPMDGTFESMVADQRGSVRCQRAPF